MFDRSRLAARWPDQLVDRIAARDFLLVLGAGASAACTNDLGASPPDWRSLLQNLSTSLAPPAKEAASVKSLIGRNSFLEAAELLRATAKGQAKEKDFLPSIAQAVDGKAGHHFKSSVLHEALLRLDPIVVVTTNYDRLWERASESAYKLHNYQSETLAYEVRAGSPYW